MCKQDIHWHVCSSMIVSCWFSRCLLERPSTFTFKYIDNHSYARSFTSGRHRSMFVRDRHVCPLHIEFSYISLVDIGTARSGKHQYSRWCIDRHLGKWNNIDTYEPYRSLSSSPISNRNLPTIVSTTSSILFHCRAYKVRYKTDDYSRINIEIDMSMLYLTMIHAYVSYRRKTIFTVTSMRHMWK
jgi:hypothetical protein